MNEIDSPIPTFAELMEVAPTVTIVILVVAIGYWAGFKSREDHIETLKQWVEYLNNKKD
jgi:hypothetical protein